MKLKDSFTKVTLLSKILALLLFVILPFLGVYIGVKYQKLITIPSSCPKVLQKPDTCLTQDLSAPISGVYVDKENFYQIDLPESWLASKEKDGDLLIQSPDLLIENEGYGLPVRGAEISMRVQSTNYDNFDEYLVNKDFAGTEGSMNFRNVYVDGVKALQYEWAWEGYGTSTVFIKNNRLYTFTMFYNYDQKSKDKYLEKYNQILKDFKFTEKI